MRIGRLDLSRYGKFSDRSLNFGAAPAGAADFHIVYGLNETGKSTAAAAILDLLFGIDKQSAYGAAKGRASVPNWHAYNTMRIGARLELGDRAYEVARLKRDKMSLVDADDRPFDESLLKAELAGVDREAFRMMFSLDDDSLEDGGEAILASHGNLGELLFSASAGLAEISGRLDALRRKADEFYRSRASTTELAKLKHALDELKAQRDAADTLASAYAELVHERAEARKAYDDAASALSERRRREDEIQRVLAALPHLAALREAEGRLEPLEGLPAPPEGWRDEAARLAAEAIKLATQRESAESAIRTLTDELELLGDDAAALKVAGRVDAWRVLRSRYETAADIPARQGELAGKRAAIEEIVRRLGRSGEADPEGLLLSVGAVGALEDLIARRSGVEARLEAARAALEEAEAGAAQALAEAPPSGARGVAIEAVKARLHAARRDDSALRARALRADADKQSRRLANALDALAPWRGGLGELALVSVPGEAETQALRERLSQARALHGRQAERLAAKTGEAERLRAEATAARAPDLIGDERAAEIRAAREALWSAHRAELTVASADAFEAALRRDDAAGAARLGDARELAAERERATTLAGVEADCARSKADLNAVEIALAALDREIEAAAPVTPPAGRDALSFVDAWRARRDEALSATAVLDEIKDAQRRIEHEAACVREALSEALRDAGLAHDPEGLGEALIEAAEAVIAGEAKLAALRQKAEERRADAARAQSKFRNASEADLNWRAAWREACAGTWLGEAGEEPAPGAVRQTLKALEELRAMLKERADLADRIAKMERDKRRFADEVAAAAAALGLDNVSSEVSRRAEAVEERVARARENARRRAEKAAGLDDARGRLAAIVEALDVNARQARAMTGLFAVDTLAEVAAKLEDCRRRDEARAEVAKAIRAIVGAGVAASLAAARAVLEGADAAALAAEHAQLKTRAPHDDQAHAEAHSAHREAARRVEAVGGDDAVARIEEKRRTILEEIKDGARRYLSLRAGVAAADEALRLYRDRHRGAMMERASRAFSLISRGAYRGLATAPNGGSETLIALGADGGSKEAEQLSKGARFQLYLALRVAGYHELAKTRRPAPFVADDIMETFDHFRAEEALRLFAEMARVGQVIYFTHHQHLAEIAKAVCPSARVHELQ